MLPGYDLTHMHRILKTMRTALNEKMLAIPTARHRMMHSTPVLTAIDCQQFTLAIDAM